MIFELFHSIYVLNKSDPHCVNLRNKHTFFCVQNFNITILGFLLLKVCYALSVFNRNVISFLRLQCYVRTLHKR